MKNTKKSFKDKWENNKKLVFQETLKNGSDIQTWILQRNGWNSKQCLRSYLKEKKRILDAGCGNGRVTALLRECSDPRYTEVVGIDLVSDKVAKNNLKGYKNVSVYRKDLLSNLNNLGKFDFIYCQEVLHHTAHPEKAFTNLTKILKQNGEIAVYVYKKKAPVREFIDDYIRDNISCLKYEDAIRATDQITKLGKVLSGKKMKINIPQVDVLQIKKGTYDLQRFIYHHFMKCFWNDHLSFKENSVINYDWYHPQICSRHTIKEVQSWYKSNKIKIIHENTDDYGITIRGIKI